MTLTIDIPSELRGRLQEEADRKGVAPEDYVQMVLEERLLAEHRQQSFQRDKPSAWSVLKSLEGTIEGPVDWSSELDHYLYGSPKRLDTPQ